MDVVYDGVMFISIYKVSYVVCTLKKTTASLQRGTSSEYAFVRSF